MIYIYILYFCIYVQFGGIWKGGAGMTEITWVETPIISHGCRIGQDHLDRLKLGRHVIPRALYKAHLRVLKSDIYFWLCGAPRMRLLTIFRSSVIWWRMGQMHHNLAQFVGNGRLLKICFGSSQTDDWLPKYGHVKFWGDVVLQY